jgi:hypothetical protein
MRGPISKAPQIKLMSHKILAEVAWFVAQAERGDLWTLLAALETKVWIMRTRVEHRVLNVLYRIPDILLESIKARVIQLIHQHCGGELKGENVIVRSDGERFWTELPT